MLSLFVLMITNFIRRVPANAPLFTIGGKQIVAGDEDTIVVI